MTCDSKFAIFVNLKDMYVCGVKICIRAAAGRNNFDLLQFGR